MQIPINNRRTQQAYEVYQAGFLKMAGSPYVDYPMTVSIETFAYCNAACDFCPYPTMDRKGERMPDHIVYKIMDELTAIPDSVPFDINLSRVNEPFLDTRMFDFSCRVNDVLPHAKLIYFTNGSPLTPGMLDRLCEIRSVKFINISFNDHRPAEYERVMQIPFDRTAKHLDRLHELVEEGRIAYPVRLSRVGDRTEADEEFGRAVVGRWPRFEPVISPRSDWMGAVPLGGSQQIPAAGCYQWFKLHILASGREASCCINASGTYGKGDANITNVLDIYNHPRRRALRETLPLRASVPECRTCPLLS